jgi:transcriptional regulator with PAS, ATPase and Fis domain
MRSALVAVEDPLGDAVVQSLRLDTPPWNATPIRALTDGTAVPHADLVIVNDSLPERARAALLRRCPAPLLVLGQDVEKPCPLARLRRAALDAIGQIDAGELVIVDPPLRDAIRIIDGAAVRRAGVLIVGPTGVGKELLARRVHARSGRSGPLVAVNCAALVDGLAESALFGHVRGAFTGAVGSALGSFVEADKGTLFLDEVGELDLRIQAKLLRALEDGCVRAVGASRATHVDVRVVAATNSDLEQEVAGGRFRADLYFRLGTFVVRVPPLRDRPGDLRALVSALCARHERAHATSLAPAALDALLAYDWPGNVRQLRNVIERVLSLARPGTVGAEEVFAIAPELGRRHRQGATLAAFEDRRIADALDVHNGALGRAAAELGIHRTTLWRKMKRQAPPSSLTRRR